MPIDEAQVRHVARLARLAVPDSDLARFAAELGAILEHVARLQELDVRDVPPTAAALGRPGVARDDEPSAGLTASEALAGAPASAAGMFQVPRVVEG